MTQTDRPPRKQPQRRSSQELANQAEAHFKAKSTPVVALLSTEADRAAPPYLALAVAILVPPDENSTSLSEMVFHNARISSERKSFLGKTADRQSRYWLNKLTQVIKLKNHQLSPYPFMALINQGVESLGTASNVSFQAMGPMLSPNSIPTKLTLPPSGSV